MRKRQRGERERCDPGRRGENGSNKDRKGERIRGNEGGKWGGSEARISQREREVGAERERQRRKCQGRAEAGAGSSRCSGAMLAPQSLIRSRDYRIHNALGHPAVSRSPTWELQV